MYTLLFLLILLLFSSPPWLIVYLVREAWRRRQAVRTVRKASDK